MITISKSDIFCIVLIASACAQPLIFENYDSDARKAKTLTTQQVPVTGPDAQDELLIREFSYEK